MHKYKKKKFQKHIKGTVIVTLFNKLKCNNDLIKYLYAYIKTSTEQTFISTHIAFTFIIHANSLHNFVLHMLGTCFTL